MPRRWTSCRATSPSLRISSRAWRFTNTWPMHTVSPCPKSARPNPTSAGSRRCWIAFSRSMAIALQLQLLRCLVRRQTRQHRRLGIAPMRARRDRQHNTTLTHRAAHRLARKPIAASHHHPRVSAAARKYECAAQVSYSAAHPSETQAAQGRSTPRSCSRLAQQPGWHRPPSRATSELHRDRRGDSSSRRRRAAGDRFVSTSTREGRSR